MNAEIKKLWLDALEGGKYVQGIHGLRITLEDNIVRHCCLGVLCDILKNQCNGKWNYNRFISNVGESNERASTNFLPPAVRNLANITDSQEVILAIINDSSTDFNAACDFIKKHL